MCVCERRFRFTMQHVQKSEDNTAEVVLSFHM